MISYRVKDWNKLYENNRTRELKHLDWVPVPNRMDGEGYTELVHHPNGAAHLGAWLAILEIASRREVRGTFPQEGAVTLGRISHLPAELFLEVIPRLLKMGWIEVIPGCLNGSGQEQKTADFDQQVPENLRTGTFPQEGAGIPHDDAEKCLSRARELNRIEEKNTTPPTPSTRDASIFRVAGEMHSRHPARRRDCSRNAVEKSLRAILRHKHITNGHTSEYLETINENHASACASHDWQKDGGEYAKSLSNWLAPTVGRYDCRAEAPRPQQPRLVI